MSFPRANQRLPAIGKGLTLDLGGINSGKRFPSGGETTGKRIALIRSLFGSPAIRGSLSWRIGDLCMSTRSYYRYDKKSA